MTRELIYNCATPEHPQAKVLMDRIKLIETPWWWVGIHIFRESDWGRDLHDHPWSFVSLILWGG